jgi:hypothetical protein
MGEPQARGVRRGKMGRFPQPKGQRGSLKWVQLVVNNCPELISIPLREAFSLPSGTHISWLSPLCSDEFAEYRDERFLNRLGISLEQHPLTTFWPRLGPQWDALARCDSGEVFLVESKAHVKELISPGTKASGQSKILIDRSLKEVQSFLEVRAVVDWSKILYQYTNRLAHLYLLRKLNGVRAFLVFVYFIGDREMGGPLTAEEWESAIQVVKAVLSLREANKLSKYILDVFIDIAEVEKALG